MPMDNVVTCKVFSTIGYAASLVFPFNTGMVPEIQVQDNNISSNSYCIISTFEDLYVKMFFFHTLSLKNLGNIYETRYKHPANYA
ncbi:unnamed protein product [Lupinus luteus]|uniref:Uncharacterized protein n=1 Tax=Lupinus luteus TaxID=3873 RepID=A0AAV1VX32_LUPLU